MKKILAIVFVVMFVSPVSAVAEDLTLTIKMDRPSVFFGEELGLEGVIQNNTDQLIVMNHPDVIGVAKVELFEAAGKFFLRTGRSSLDDDGKLMFIPARSQTKFRLSNLGLISNDKQNKIPIGKYKLKVVLLDKPTDRKFTSPAKVNWKGPLHSNIEAILVFDPTKDNKNLVPPANTEQMTLKRSKNDDGTPQNQEWVNLMEQVDSLYDEGEYQKAIFYGKKALQVIEQFREPDHSEVMEALNNLGMLYMKTKDFTEAEPLLKRAVSIAEKRDDQETLAAALGNLANVYSDQEMYKKAEPLLVRSLSIAEKMYGPNHPDVALAINNLAVNYHCQKKYEHLVTLYKRAISILEATGSNDGVLLHLLNNLAEVYHELGVIEQSEPLYVRALSLGKKKYGRDHPEMAATMRNLARLYEETNRPLEAEELKKRASGGDGLDK